MTDVVFGGQTYSVQIDAIKQSGYTGGVSNFSDINRLPKYEVTATVNGQTFTKTVTFAGHHVIPTNVLNMSGAAAAEPALSAKFGDSQLINVRHTRIQMPD